MFDIPENTTQLVEAQQKGPSELTQFLDTLFRSVASATI